MIAYISLNNMKHVGSEVTTSLCLVVRGLGSFLPRLGESVLRGETYAPFAYTLLLASIVLILITPGYFRRRGRR